MPRNEVDPRLGEMHERALTILTSGREPTTEEWVELLDMRLELIKKIIDTLGAPPLMKLSDLDFFYHSLNLFCGPIKPDTEILFFRAPANSKRSEGHWPFWAITRRPKAGLFHISLEMRHFHDMPSRVVNVEVTPVTMEELLSVYGFDPVKVWDALANIINWDQMNKERSYLAAEMRNEVAQTEELIWRLRNPDFHRVHGWARTGKAGLDYLPCG